MAMTKAEKARVEELETLLAFRWPTEAEPQRTVRAESSSDQVEGWDFNAYNGSVDRKWTTTVSHGAFYNGKPTGASQSGIALYATEDDALVALRWKMCREMAAKLRNVDQRLELARQHPA